METIYHQKWVEMDSNGYISSWYKWYISAEVVHRFVPFEPTLFSLFSSLASSDLQTASKTGGEPPGQSGKSKLHRQSGKHARSGK